MALVAVQTFAQAVGGAVEVVVDGGPLALAAGDRGGVGGCVCQVVLKAEGTRRVAQLVLQHPKPVKRVD